MKIQEKGISNHTAFRIIPNILIVRYFFIRNQREAGKVLHSTHRRTIELKR